MHQSKPQVIFLDAVGTLFGVRGSVGEIYSCFAALVGVQVDPQLLQRAFVQSFRAAPRAAFPGVDPAVIPALELDYWQGIAAESFQRLGALEQFADFGSWFKDLFAYFATAEPWEVYPEVPEVLARWQSAGIPLGVLSNFDSRLHPVLKALELDPFFSSVTVSTAVGAAKPESGIFTAALRAQNCPPDVAWHIGDSWDEDVLGAQGAGLGAVWLNRFQAPLPMPITSTSRVLQAPDLSQLWE